MSSLSDEFEKEIDRNCSRMIESYATLIKRSKMNCESPTQLHEHIQVKAAAEAIVRSIYRKINWMQKSDQIVIILFLAQVHHSNCLLDQIHELRLRVILQDSLSIKAEAGTEQELIKESMMTKQNEKQMCEQDH